MRNTVTITLTATDLKPALKTAHTFACKDVLLSSLAGVLLTCKDGTLTMHATDRYIVVRHRLPVLDNVQDENGDADDWQAFVTLADVRALAAAIPAKGVPFITLTREEDRLTLGTGTSTVSAQVGDGEGFPRIRHLLEDGPREELPAGECVLSTDATLTTHKAFKDLGYRAVRMAHGKPGGPVHMIGTDHKSSSDVETLVIAMGRRIAGDWEAGMFR